MDGNLVPIILFLSFFGALVAITKTISDNKTKRKLIDAGASEAFVRTLFSVRQSTPNGLAALKWGLVVAGVGLALILVQFLPYDFEEPISYGLMFLFAGIGLFIYYAIASWEEGRQRGTPSRHPRQEPTRREAEAFSPSGEAGA